MFDPRGTYIRLDAIKPDPNTRFLFKVTSSYYHLGEKKYISYYYSAPSKKISEWLHKISTPHEIESIEYVDIVEKIV